MHNEDKALVLVTLHPVLNDVVCVRVSDPTKSISLSSCRVPPVPSSCSSNGSNFKSWPARADKGWPMTHRVIICNRFGGEAVLRGSDSFVRGIICAYVGIQAGEQVAVYAEIVARCNRPERSARSRGVAVEMSCQSSGRAGPVLPPLSGIMTGKIMMQNLPSIVLAHVLDPQPGEGIIDMCSAPLPLS